MKHEERLTEKLLIRLAVGTVTVGIIGMVVIILLGIYESVGSNLIRFIDFFLTLLIFLFGCFLVGVIIFDIVPKINRIIRNKDFE